jgi:alpha-tubulin suppressor-like RCC1 family protein
MIAITVAKQMFNDYGQCDVSRWRDIVAVAAGSTHTLGLRADGTVMATGNNSDGQCEIFG